MLPRALAWSQCTPVQILRPVLLRVGLAAQHVFAQPVPIIEAQLGSVQKLCSRERHVVVVYNSGSAWFEDGHSLVVKLAEGASSLSYHLASDIQEEARDHATAGKGMRSVPLRGYARS